MTEKTEVSRTYVWTAMPRMAPTRAKARLKLVPTIRLEALSHREELNWPEILMVLDSLVFVVMIFSEIGLDE